MIRNTRQRAAIRRAFHAAGRPLSPAEALAGARREVRSLGLATVYRNIRALLDDGWLHQIDLPGEAARYEIAGQPHHHHFRCDRCRRVFDVPCPGAPPVDGVPAGFVVTAHDVLLQGRCADCGA